MKHSTPPRASTKCMRVMLKYALMEPMLLSVILAGMMWRHSWLAMQWDLVNLSIVSWVSNETDHGMYETVNPIHFKVALL